MYNNKRSKQAIQRRRNNKHDFDVANGIVIDWSWHDLLKVPGEIVFAQITVTTVREKINERLGYVPESALNRDFGEVLNYQ